MVLGCWMFCLLKSQYKIDWDDFSQGGLFCKLYKLNGSDSRYGTHKLAIWPIIIVEYFLGMWSNHNLYRTHVCFRLKFLLDAYIKHKWS